MSLSRFRYTAVLMTYVYSGGQPWKRDSILTIRCGGWATRRSSAGCYVAAAAAAAWLQAVMLWLRCCFVLYVHAWNLKPVDR
jgi:hypothetical protein